MSVPPSPPSNQRARIAVAAVLKVLGRILLVVLAAILVGVLIYLGFVTVYQQAVLPARENANRLSLLETGQALDALQLDQSLESIQQRLAALESQRQNSSDNLDELVASQSEALERLDSLQAELESLSLYADKAWSLGYDGYQRSQYADQEIRFLKQQIEVLKVAGLLNRSRMYLLQSNFGLARDQVEAARGLLVDLLNAATEAQKIVLIAWIERLDAALGYLPESPVLAADELEIAWSLVLRGLPEHRTPTPTPYFPPGATPTAIPTFTRTPLRPPATLTPAPPNARTPTATPTPNLSPT